MSVAYSVKDCSSFAAFMQHQRLEQASQSMKPFSGSLVRFLLACDKRSYCMDTDLRLVPAPSENQWLFLHCFHFHIQKETVNYIRLLFITLQTFVKRATVTENIYQSNHTPTVGERSYQTPLVPMLKSSLGEGSS